jgi:hypothetical protein
MITGDERIDKIFAKYGKSKNIEQFKKLDEERRATNKPLYDAVDLLETEAKKYLKLYVEEMERFFDHEDDHSKCVDECEGMKAFIRSREALRQITPIVGFVFKLHPILLELTENIHMINQAFKDNNLDKSTLWDKIKDKVGL